MEGSVGSPALDRMSRLSALVALTFGSLAMLAPPSARATFPGRNGAILATFDDHNRPFVRAIDPRAGTARVLFECSRSDCPDFIDGIGVSANGMLAAFDGTTFIDRGVSETRISILQIASRQVRQLPLLHGGLDAEADQDPSWSPGTNQLLLAIRTPDAPLGLFTASAAGGHLHKLLTCDCFHAAVSPNGRLILFERGQDLWLARSDGSSPRRFAREAEQPSWSPGGGRVAFVSLAHGHRDLVVARADGTARRTIAAEVSSPVWSPNGQLLAFDRCPRCLNNDNTSSIYSVRPDGTGARALFTDHPGTDIGFGQLDWQALPG